MLSIAYLTAFLLLLNLGTSQSNIILPKEGAHIKPGASFDFLYGGYVDYCSSSWNFTVYLFTKKPTFFNPSRNWASGYYFGRFGIPNYPGNPYPPNLAPTSLVMPDFSLNTGGFQHKVNVTNLTVWLTVLEELGTCGTELGPSIGPQLALSWIKLVYNATGNH